VLAAMMALPAAAQDSTVTAADQTEVAVPQAPLLIVDRNRLLAETLFGKALEAQFEADSKALIAENLRLEQALEAEERDLTERRATLPAEEFQTLAAAFDRKTEEIRTAQDAKSRAITSRREEQRQLFLQAAVPVLAALMREAGAIAIFDKDLVILSFRGADITDEAIARIDEVLGDGTDPGAVAPETGVDAAPEAGAGVETDGNAP
jgi:Skp family chaperone for outer membrane proteins